MDENEKGRKFKELQAKKQEFDRKAEHARQELDSKAEHAKQSLNAGAQNLKNEKEQNARKLILSTVKIAVLVLLVIGVPLYLYFFKMDWLRGFKDIESLFSQQNTDDRRLISWNAVSLHQKNR